MDSEEFSCIKKVVKTVQLSLPFMYVSNDIAGITGVLEGWKRQFVKQLNGIVVSYQNISLVSRVGAVSNIRSYAIYNVKATFDLFCPNIGDVVKGKINRISREHIGCLIQGTINVTIHLPRVYPPELSKYIYLDREILFEIANFVAEPKVMRVTGNITPKCIELMSILYLSVENSVLGKETSSSDDESMQVNLSILNSMKLNEDIKPKKIKKQKRESESSTVEPAEEFPDDDESMQVNLSILNSMKLNEDIKPKKIKKRKRESESSTVEPAEEFPDEEIPVVNNKSPKKKKSKNRDSIATDSLEKSPKKKKSPIDSESNLTDSCDKSPKKKKSKVKLDSTDSPKKSPKKKSKNNIDSSLVDLFLSPKKEHDRRDSTEAIPINPTALDLETAFNNIHMLEAIKSETGSSAEPSRNSTISDVNKKKRKRESSTEDVGKKKKRKKKSKDGLKSSKSKDKKKLSKKKAKVAASGSVLKKDKKSRKGKKSSKKENADSKSKSSKKKSKKGHKKEKNKKIKLDTNLETKDETKIKLESE